MGSRGFLPPPRAKTKLLRVLSSAVSATVPSPYLAYMVQSCPLYSDAGGQGEAGACPGHLTQRRQRPTALSVFCRGRRRRRGRGRRRRLLGARGFLHPAAELWSFPHLLHRSGLGDCPGSSAGFGVNPGRERAERLDWPLSRGVCWGKDPGPQALLPRGSGAQVPAPPSPSLQKSGSQPSCVSQASCSSFPRHQPWRGV